MKYITSLFIIVVLVSCSSVPVIQREAAATGLEMPKTSVDSIRQYLIISSATDFNKFGPKNITGFRNVKMGYITHTDENKMYFICGEFLTAQGVAKSEWIPFITIKTSGYEQYIGQQTKTYSEDPNAKWESGDLSSLIMGRLNSMKKEIK